jgi:TPR repeat protein
MSTATQYANDRKADPQPPPGWELPELELRILAPPRPGPRDRRWYLGGIIALFIITCFAGPYLREHPVASAPTAPGGIERADVPAALRAYYDRALTGDAGAMRTLGHMYCRGVEVPRDTQAGICWYRLAAAAGDAEAARELDKLGLHPEL